MLRTLCSVFCVLFVASVSPEASSKESAKPAVSRADKPPKLELKRWQQVLETGAEAETLQVLAELKALGTSASPAAPLVDNLLRRGANERTLIAALETAAALAARPSSEAIAPYVAHRKPDIRSAAARALAATGGPTAVGALRSALAGPDPAVRALAASGLGALGAKDAVKELFIVLERDTPEAAISIAKLCNPEQCDQLIALVGKIRFEALEESFVPLLFRPPAELPDANKLRYIDRLRRLATKRAAAVLNKALTQLPKEQSQALRTGLEVALRERPVTGDAP